MKNFNKRFHASCMRKSFWHRLREILARAESVSQRQGQLTSEDVRVLKIVRQAIRESYERSETALEYHSRQLEKLRREYLNER